MSITSAVMTADGMKEPRNYPDLMSLDAERERNDLFAGVAPVDTFGAEIADRMNANPEFREWAERHVRVLTPLEAVDYFAPRDPAARARYYAELFPEEKTA